MDEQGETVISLSLRYTDGIDQEWLDTINAERQKEQAGAISYEIFEIIMDKLEKEWFNLVRLLSYRHTRVATYNLDQTYTPACITSTSRRL
jgi:NuA3 HAT complex component NTO1